MLQYKPHIPTFDCQQDTGTNKYETPLQSSLFSVIVVSTVLYCSWHPLQPNVQRSELQDFTSCCIPWGRMGKGEGVSSSLWSWVYLRDYHKQACFLVWFLTDKQTVDCWNGFIISSAGSKGSSFFEGENRAKLGLECCHKVGMNPKHTYTHARTHTDTHKGLILMLSCPVRQLSFKTCVLPQFITTNTHLHLDWTLWR